MKKVIIIFAIIVFAGCSTKKDCCPAYTYDVINGDSVRYAK